MLRRLRIWEFKAYKQADDIPLEGLTALIGANGSGKTTILQAIQLLGGLVQGTLPQYLESLGMEYRDLPHNLGGGLRFGVEASFGTGQELRWRVDLETRRRPGIATEEVVRRDAPTTKRPAGEVTLLHREGRQMWRLDEKSGRQEKVQQTLASSWLTALTDASKKEKERFKDLVALATWASGVRSYTLDPSALRSTQRGSEDVDDLGASGSHLARFLDSLRRRDSAAYERVIERVQRCYPRLQSLTIKRSQFGWQTLFVTERWGSKAITFNARQVSDGLLRLLAISALHELPAPPSMILIDELENGLHPHLLGGLIQMLQSLVDGSKGQTQVVFTTHSPVALNFVNRMEQVLLVSRRQDGVARITRLSDVPRAQKLRAQQMDLGEIWYNLGDEKLVAG